MQPDGVNIWYFKVKLFDLTELFVQYIKGIRHWAEKIKRLENQSLGQKENLRKKKDEYKFF